MLPEAMIIDYADDHDAKLERRVAALTDDTSDGPFTSSRNALRQRICERPEVFNAVAELDDKAMDQLMKQIARKRSECERREDPFPPRLDLCARWQKADVPQLARS